MIRFMNNFWWRCAVVPIDRRPYWLSCWIYNWTKRMNTPWYLLRYPEDQWRRPDLRGWRKAPRLVASVALVPVGLVIWLWSGRRWPFIEEPRQGQEVPQ